MRVTSGHVIIGIHACHMDSFFLCDRDISVWKSDTNNVNETVHFYLRITVTFLHAALQYFLSMLLFSVWFDNLLTCTSNKH